MTPKLKNSTSTRLSAVLAGLMCPYVTVAQGQGSPSTDLESELFGSPAGPSEPIRPSSQDAPGQPPEEQTTANSKPPIALGSTEIGGRADLSLSAIRFHDEPLNRMTWRTRPAAYLYLDSRPRSDTRGYLRVALTPQSPPFGSPTSPLASAPQPASGSSSLQLLELWGKWQPEGSPIFWTAGRQPIRWGAAQFWNPTDFMSPEVLDPLASFDDRRGTDALRVNLPFESLNSSLIFVASLLPPPPAPATSPSPTNRPGSGEPAAEVSTSQTQDIQWAARAEWSLGSMETAVSFAWSPRGPTRTGVSLSSGLGPIDLVFEGVCVARSKRRFFGQRAVPQNSPSGAGEEPSRSTLVTTVERNQACLPQGVAGLAWQQSYGNSDSLTLGGEYFWNGLGHDSPALELAAALTGNATPLYIGQEYVAAYALLPGPLSWDSTTFQAQFITNLSDASRLYRASVSTEILKSSTLTLAAVWRDGLGEFRLDDSTVTRAARGLAPTAAEATSGSQMGKALARQTPRLAIDVTMSLSL